jgi:SAM-dependent methyltransferase
MTHAFDKAYWESHWRESDASGLAEPVNPYLVEETHGLVAGTAVDAGCGEGAEALWLAEQGWEVTAVDISAVALDRARARAAQSLAAQRVSWVEADLSGWEPDRPVDLVTTHYTHPAMPMVEFYDRMAGWVAPGGTLLIVGHLHTDDAGPHHDHAGGTPAEQASVTVAAVTERFDPDTWTVVTAAEHTRVLTDQSGESVTLHDVVVRATRRTSTG